MRLKRCVVIVSALCVSGCGASLPGLSTGSLFGGKSEPANTAPVIKNDPTSRALQVGSTAARAQKCGFNFDAIKLKNNYLAAEGPALTNPSDVARVGQVYDTSYSAVSKAVAAQPGDVYCSPAKTAKIKTALTRHLAGDYTPEPPEPVQEEEGGLFSGLSSGSSSSAPNPAPGLDQ
ncbi:MAG: hypothetical protein CTY31_03995 [Hyphomicrobium sp.]|nr:MAG: hypothetical protein CTY39_08430 [Hyphomicrobium sp.]PPD02009.1 MAG: hypothetical protein CTY31_03995 [Hyphomicrobium sp.]